MFQLSCIYLFHFFCFAKNHIRYFRLYHINAERNQIWKQITDSTNEKYGSELGDLTIEQTKKLFANYKRKSQLVSFNSNGGATSRSDAGSINGTASAE